MIEAPRRILDAAALAPDAARRRPPRVLAQARFDARIILRNGEQVLLTLVLPALALVGLTLASVPTWAPGRRVDVVVPGVLALAVLSTAFTGQAIGTAFDRRYGVLRLLGTTPLGRGGLLAGRVLAVLAIEAVQIAVLGALGIALGWRPHAAGSPRHCCSCSPAPPRSWRSACCSPDAPQRGRARGRQPRLGGARGGRRRAGARGAARPGAGSRTALPSGALGSRPSGGPAGRTARRRRPRRASAWAVAGTLAAVRWFRWD